MANKYLEKLAGTGIFAPLTYLGRKAGAAAGLGERNYIAKTLRTNDPNRVMKLGENFLSDKTKATLVDAHMANHGLTKDQAMLKLDTDLADLRERKIDARLITGGVGVGGLVGYNKYKTWASGGDQPTYYE